MKNKIKTPSFRALFILTVMSFFACSSTAVSEDISPAQAPAHFYNQPELVHPDPNHTPGDYALPETHNARTVYQTLKANLIQPSVLLSEDSTLVTLGVGEITFSSTKNETAKVLGYFRNYVGLASLSDRGFEGLEMLIDVNSLDTAVPGRNNRILDIFFNSTKPELGHAKVEFKELQLGDRTLQELKNGSKHVVSATGMIMLNEIKQTLGAELLLQYQNGVWAVQTKKPVVLKISDFSFKNRIYELMKSCNHVSIGNDVEVDVELYFK